MIGFTGAAIAISFGWLGVESAEKWQYVSIFPGSILKTELLTVSFLRIGTGLYIVGCLSLSLRNSPMAPTNRIFAIVISYQGALTFWTAAFPQLARCLPEMQESQAKLISGETTFVSLVLIRRHPFADLSILCSAHAHNQLDSLSRNRISNISFTICSIGELVLLAIMVGILKGIHSSDSVEQNTKVSAISSIFHPPNEK